jgi:hypothetical protein
MGSRLSTTQRLLVKRICEILVENLLEFKSEDFTVVKEKFKELGLNVTTSDFLELTLEQVNLFEDVKKNPQRLFNLESSDRGLVKHVLINHFDEDNTEVNPKEIRNLWKKLLNRDK